MNHMNRYAQGTVWHWSRGTNERLEKGVQSDERPVIVISNNIFNMSSPVVNCLTITSVLKNSPVHVPVHLFQPSHIQCEQIHTIRKTNLKYYKGTVQENTLKEVKEKLKFQLNIDSDNVFSQKNKEIETILKEILEEVNLGFKDSKRDMYMISLIRSLLASQTELNKNFITFTNTHSVTNCPDVFDESEKAFEEPEFEKAFEEPEFEKTFEEPEKAQENQTQSEAPGLDVLEQLPKKPDVLEEDVLVEKEQKVRARKGYRKYTDEDIRYITDENNTPEELMSKYGLSNKISAYNLRNRMKRKL